MLGQVTPALAMMAIPGPGGKGGILKSVHVANEIIDNARLIIKLNLTDGMKLPTNKALEKAINFLGEGYYEVKKGSGRFISKDGTRIIRIGDADILGKHAGGPHINFETLVPNPKKPGKKMVETNLHIFIED